MEPSTGKKLRRTAPPAERRQQLIDAAMAAIAEHGLSGTTTADVAGRAGLSVGLVNHHFTSKDNLLASVLPHLAKEMRRLWFDTYLSQDVSATTKLETIVSAVFHPSACTPTKVAVWFAFFGDAGYREAYRAMVDDFDNERTQAIEDLCGTIKAEGSYENVDPSAVAHSVEALADGLWLGLLLYPDWMSRETAKDRVADLLILNFPGHFGREAVGVNSAIHDT